VHTQHISRQGSCCATTNSLKVQPSKRNWRMHMMISEPFYAPGKSTAHRRCSPRNLLLGIKAMCFPYNHNSKPDPVKLKWCTIYDNSCIVNVCADEVVKKGGQLYMTGKAYNNRCIAEWLHNVTERHWRQSSDPRAPLAHLLMSLCPFKF